MKRRILALILGALLMPMMLSLSSCGEMAAAQAKDLMEGIQANAVNTEVQIDGAPAAAITDFAAGLFAKTVKKGENTLISPLSVIYALGMTANGAAGNTLAQMETVFGLSVSELNEYLHVYMNSLENSDKFKLDIANSIWFKDDASFRAEQSFLQTNADWYGADLYKAPFDEGTLGEINDWVSDKTDGMIKKILDLIPDRAVMYLINAIAFDAEWETIYQEQQINDGTFTKEDGTEQQVKMMSSEERRYLEDDDATGFIKYYAGQKYAFAALLPDEDVQVADYAASLTGEKIQTLLTNVRNVHVNAKMPKFEYDYSTEMSEVLSAMGMEDAFNAGVADFSKLGSSDEGDLAISRVLHKTFIAVDERGTKAGAVTAVEMNATSALIEDIKTVCLDRPFVYMLIDCEANIPVFIGTVCSIDK